MVAALSVVSESSKLNSPSQHLMKELLDGLPLLRGVVHVGAHHGQEGAVYHRLGMSNICWVEPQPGAFARLTNNAVPGSVFFNCALGAEPGRRPLHLAQNQGLSSSLLPPKEHLIVHPGVRFEGTLEVNVRRLAELPLDFSLFNLLVMDVQGAELDVLRGGVEVLNAFDYIIAEVQSVELYEGCALLPQLAEWLSHRGFCCERVIWNTNCWGNALFASERALTRPAIHAFILNPGRLYAPVKLLEELIRPHVDLLTVISSSKSDADTGWIVLDANASVKDQWNCALSEFRGDVLFHHQSTAILLGGDYERLIQCGRQSFRAHGCGVYAPQVDHSKWNSAHHGLPERGPGLFTVQNTDSICWMIHADILDSQKSFEVPHDLEISSLYCGQAKKLGRAVLRDYRFLVNNPAAVSE